MPCDNQRWRLSICAFSLCICTPIASILFLYFDHENFLKNCIYLSECRMSVKHSVAAGKQPALPRSLLFPLKPYLNSTIVWSDISVLTDHVFIFARSFSAFDLAQLGSVPQIT